MTYSYNVQRYKTKGCQLLATGEVNSLDDLPQPVKFNIERFFKGARGRIEIVKAGPLVDNPEWFEVETRAAV